VAFLLEKISPIYANTSNVGGENSVVPPALLISGLNAWNLWNEHWEHWEHMPPLEERPEYAYQNIRMKSYPWGDGDKVSRWLHLPHFPLWLPCDLL
jgi:hypothetical protein